MIPRSLNLVVDMQEVVMVYFPARANFQRNTLDFAA